MEVAPNPRYSGGSCSFKLVRSTPAPKTVSEMTQLLRETQNYGDTQTIKETQMNTQNTNHPACKNWMLICWW